MIDRPSVTGGQLCVRGVLYQMLKGLAQGMSLAVRSGDFTVGELTSVLLVLEPASGGDVRLHADGLRVVEQVKIRTTGRPWTAGQIAGDVLPDLLLAVRDDGSPARYIFSTDGHVECDDLLRLCGRLKGRPLPSDVLAGLDDADDQAFSYGGPLSERRFFERLAERAGCDDPSRLWRLLAGFEIEAGRSDVSVREDIDRCLSDLVDAHEDVGAKRDQLVGMMMELARNGAEVKLASLLADAGIPVERALHHIRLPDVTRDALERQLTLLGYDPAHDVREAIGIEPLGLSLLSGDSGFGKSWRLAAELAWRSRSGGLVVWVGAATDLASVLRKVVEVVWHSSFDRDQSLPGLQRRLGDRFLDAGGAWLTVGVDDVQSRSLLEEMRTADWGAYGVRLLATVPTEIARTAAAKPLPPHVVPVGRFSHGELRRFLASHGKDLRRLPDDVVELLRTPIFAELYRRIDTPAWAPTGEYELVDRFWRHATYEARSMPDFQDDPAALVRLASTVLSTSGRYPFSPGAAQAAGLDQSARSRLAATGVIRQSEDGSQMIHDRVLNWAVALDLAGRLAAGTLTPDDAVSALVNTGRPETLAPGIGSRLGYVMADFLWLSSGIVEGSIVAAVITRLIGHPDYRMGMRTFFAEHLVSLGPRILPALRHLSVTGSDGGMSVAGHAAEAIGRIGIANDGSADAVVGQLLADVDDDEPVKAGLIAAAIVPIPREVERLWSIHRERREASDAAADEDVDHRYRLFSRRTASWNALSTAVGAAPSFVERKLHGTNDALSAELLLDLLIAMDHEVGAGIWERTRTILLERVPRGCDAVPDAIGRFGDAGEAWRLERASPSAGWHEPYKRFRALVRVDAARAAAHIHAAEGEVISRPCFSMSRLIRNGGDTVRAALRQRQAEGWQGMADLADLYRDEALQIDEESFRAMIRAFEDRLLEVGAGPWRPTREISLLRFLARTTRPDLLAVLESYRGSTFERLLRDRALARGRRKTLSADPDADSCERLLLAIGGEAYGETVAAALADPAAMSRVDGAKAVIKLPSGSAYAAPLEAIVDDPKRTDIETYDLMLALAVHLKDADLYRLVMRTSSAFHDAIDVRRKMGPWPDDVDARIRSDLRSDDSPTRIGASCALAMAPPDDVARLLADTLSRCPDGDPSALTVVRMASHLGVYDPRMMDQLRRMAWLDDGKVRDEVVPYLAEHGDEVAMREVTAMLGADVVSRTSSAMLRAAYALTERDPTNQVATEKLGGFVERHFGIYPVGLIAKRLAERGALADEAIVDIGYAAKRLSAADIHYLVERVALCDRDEAIAILERRFDDAPSAGSARQLLELGGADAIDHLLAAYGPSTKHEVRWIVSRALRRHADRRDLLARLEAKSASGQAADRIVAAEVLGWIPSPPAERLLDLLAADRNPDVSDAAIEAEGRHRAERCAKALIAGIPEAAPLGKWSRLWALTDVADPFLLEVDGDGLAIGGMIDGMDEIFAIWTERELVQRKKALIKDAEQRDRRL
ncbi:hypothetical protein [Sphingomonas parapaucimobilis]|uniref:hypothetical protein n=1 Tax=Sphingomonas parapaucimobilis TaxID=28213 RepID=UPI00321A1BDC